MLTIYEVLSGESRRNIEERFNGKGYGKGYGALKKEVANIVIDKLKPIQNRYYDIMKNPDYIEQILQKGADKAKRIASSTFSKVRASLGIG